MKKSLFLLSVLSCCISGYASIVDNMVEELRVQDSQDSAPQASESSVKAKSTVLPSNAFLIDESAALIEGLERKHVVCKSDLERVAFHGRKETFDEIKEAELALQDAMKYKIPVDESVTDRYITMLCKQHGLKKSDIDVIFKNSGLTPQEGREALLKLYTKQMMIDQRVLSRLVIPDHEVKEYFDAHPLYKEAKYAVQISVVPLDGPEAAQKKELMQKLAQGDDRGLAWSDPFSLKESDIAEDKQFITALEPGQIAEPVLINGNFHFFKLVSKKDRVLVSLEKRYREIVDTLRMPKMAQSIEHYFKELEKDAYCVELS